MLTSKLTTVFLLSGAYIQPVTSPPQLTLFGLGLQPVQQCHKLGAGAGGIRQQVVIGTLESFVFTAHAIASRTYSERLS